MWESITRECCCIVRIDLYRALRDQVLLVEGLESEVTNRVDKSVVDEKELLLMLSSMAAGSTQLE